MHGDVVNVVRSCLLVREHGSKSYSPRTYHNAAAGDVTIAFAVDFSTRGEALTHRAAGDRYLAADMSLPPVEVARCLYKRLRESQGKVVNVAGNSLHTLSKHGWTQESANAYVFAVLSQVYEHYRFERVVSGGQTGIDLAGGVSGVALGIETIMTMPKGLLQRNAQGVDSDHSKEDIEAQVLAGVRALHADVTEPVWTLGTAEAFVEQFLATELASIGLVAEIVGSVKTKGASHNDLDIKLIPLREMSLGEAMDGIDAAIVPVFCAERQGLGPHPSCYDDVDTWFFNIQLEDGRVVELYLPADEFLYEMEEEPGAADGLNL